MEALGTTAPLASLTVPTMRPASFCPKTSGIVMADSSAARRIFVRKGTPIALRIKIRRTIVSIPLYAIGATLQMDKFQMKKWSAGKLDNLAVGSEIKLQYHVGG